MAFGRQVSREVLIYTLGLLVSSGIQYLAVPVYTRVFGPAEYGQLALVLAITTMAAGLAFVGGDVALARFWFSSSDGADRRGLAMAWIATVTALTALVALALCLAAGVLSAAFSQPELPVLLLIGSVTLIPMQSSRLLAQVFRNEFRPWAFALTSVALGTATLVLGLAIALALGLGIAGILLGMLVAECLVLALRAVMLRPVLRTRPRWQFVRPMLRFGLPLVPTTVAFWVMTSADRVVVQYFAGSAQLGLYAVAGSIAAVLWVITVGIGQGWSPRIVASFEADEALAARQTTSALLVVTAGAAVLGVLVMAAAPEIVHVVSGNAYAAAAAILPPLAVAAVLYCTTVITPTGLVLTKRTVAMAVITASAAVANLAVALVLTPVAGAVGTAWATAIGFAVMTGGFWYWSGRVFPAATPWPRLIAVLAILLGVAAVVGRWDGSLPQRVVLAVVAVAALALVGLGPSHLRRLLRPVESRSSRVDGGA